MLSKFYDPLLTLVFPHACRVCGGSVENFADGPACSSCWEKTRVFDGSETLCSKCGAFLSEARSERVVYCRRCDDQSFDRAFAAGFYENALTASVLNLKREPFISKRLKSIFIKRFEQSDLNRSEVIIPVPLSSKRRLERGFNQAEIIADVLSKATGLSVDSRSLVRKIHTPVHRAGMDRKARELTVKNAFEVKRKNLIEGKTILLVDDIFTSGSTASYCAKVLKKNGANEVFVLTLARAD